LNENTQPAPSRATPWRNTGATTVSRTTAARHVAGTVVVVATGAVVVATLVTEDGFDPLDEHAVASSITTTVIADPQMPPCARMPGANVRRHDADRVESVGAQHLGGRDA
jgi:hypothetical protein